MKKLLNFIKYNNAFTIIISLVMFSTAGAFANEKVRDTVIGQTIVTKNGTDNTQIISADLDNFDMGLKIKSVKEDTQFYYVNFDYNAIDAKDGVWQSVKKEKNLNVSKIRLGNMDLGVYLAEELKQLTDREFVYMKEVQNIEKNRGAQKQTESVEYTGLKGLVFDNRTKEIVGYEAVKEEKNQKAEVLGVFNPSTKNEEENKAEKEEEKVVQQITVVKETVSKETIMEMVREAMAQENGGNSSISSSSSVAASSSTESSASSQSSISNFQSSSSSQFSSENDNSSSLSAGGAGSSASETSSSSSSSSSEATSSVSSSSSLETNSSSSEISSSSSSSEASSSSSEAVSSSSSSSAGEAGSESSSSSEPSL